MLERAERVTLFHAVPRSGACDEDADEEQEAAAGSSRVPSVVRRTSVAAEDGR